MEQIEDYFGGVNGHSVISAKPLGSRTCYLFVLLEYENGVAFAVATMYRVKTGQTAATSFFFKTEPEAIFPKQLLVESK